MLLGLIFFHLGFNETFIYEDMNALSQLFCRAPVSHFSCSKYGIKCAEILTWKVSEVGVLNGFWFNFFHQNSNVNDNF